MGGQGFPQLGEDEHNAHLVDGITQPVPPSFTAAFKMEELEAYVRDRQVL